MVKSSLNEPESRLIGNASLARRVILYDGLLSARRVINCQFENRTHEPLG